MRGCSRPARVATFTSRRDAAIIPLLVDPGMRRAECVGTTLHDLRTGGFRQVRLRAPRGGSHRQMS
jgi:integrase